MAIGKTEARARKGCGPFLWGIYMYRLLRTIAAQPWAMSPDYVTAMLDVIAYRMQNGQRDSAEIEARIGGRKERKVSETNGNIAVIPVRGAIANRSSMIEDLSVGMGTSAERLDQQIRAAYDDRDTKAIILDVDSPGGSAAGTPELGDTIRSLRGGEKPIIAQVQGLSASAAYWIASSADEVVASPSSQVGSIGVITVHEEVSRLLEEEGVTETIISAGKYKAEGNPFEPLDDEAREYTQSLVDKYYDMFLAAVAEGRGTDKDKVRSDYGEGRVMLADDARKAGMIDRVGTMRETVERLGGRLGGSRRERAGNARSVALEKRRLNLAAKAARERGHHFHS